AVGASGSRGFWGWRASAITRSIRASWTARAPASRRSGRRSSRKEPTMSDGEPRRAGTIVGALALVGAMVAGIAAIQLLVDQSYRVAATRRVAAGVLP